MSAAATIHLDPLLQIQEHQDYAKQRRKQTGLQGRVVRPQILSGPAGRGKPANDEAAHCATFSQTTAYLSARRKARTR